MNNLIEVYQTSVTRLARRLARPTVGKKCGEPISPACGKSEEPKETDPPERKGACDKTIFSPLLLK